MKAVFRDPKPEDVESVAARMRPMDRLECAAMLRMGPKQALELSMRASDWVMAGEAEGEVWCLFGVTPGDLLEDEGHPWMLGAAGIERHARAFLEEPWPFIEAMDYRKLTNLVHRDNAAARRWLRRLGFTFGAEEMRGGEPFVWFSMERA